MGSDHGGYDLKCHIIQYLIINEYRVYDVFCLHGEPCDYPDCAKVVCENVLKNEDSLGIVICGTGIGISIASNKINGIRCALCYNKFTGEMAKKHNNANVIALGGRILSDELAVEILEQFLSNRYEGDRHQNRIFKIKELEKFNNKIVIKSQHLFI